MHELAATGLAYTALCKAIVNHNGPNW